MGLELMKNGIIVAVLAVLLLVAGGLAQNIGSASANHDSTISGRAGSPSIIPEEMTEGAASSSEDARDGTASPPNTDTPQADEAVSDQQNSGKSGEQSSEEEDADANKADQGASAGGENPEQPERSVDGGKNGAGSFWGDKIFWVLGGAASALLAASVWYYFRRKQINGTGWEGENQCLADKSRILLRVGILHNIGRRGEQQDSFCLSDIDNAQDVANKGIMAVVADGMGGLEAGAAISQLVADVFRQGYSRVGAIKSPGDFLYDTAREAEMAAEKYMTRTGVDGGSTLVAVLLRENALHFISVGDSHIYHLRGNELTQINHEHNFAAVLKEKASRGEVAPDEPYVNPRRNSLTAYIGMGSFQIVDQNDEPRVLLPGDKVLLCTDGVFGTLQNGEIRDVMNGDAVSAALSMEKAVLAKDNPKQDNFTGVILEYVAARET